MAAMSKHLLASLMPRVFTASWPEGTAIAVCALNTAFVQLVAEGLNISSDKKEITILRNYVSISFHCIGPYSFYLYIKRTMTTDFRDLLIKSVDKSTTYQMEQQGYFQTSAFVAFEEERKLLTENLKEGVELTLGNGSKRIKVVVCGVDEPKLINDQWKFPYRIRLVF